MADSKKKNDESTEEVSQNTAAQVYVPSLIQKITQLEAEVYSLKQIIAKNFNMQRKRRKRYLRKCSKKQ